MRLHHRTFRCWDISFDKLRTVREPIQNFPWRFPYLRYVTTLSGQGVNSISDEEFIHYMRRCRPSERWPDRIAVAFSGGPDSTCLLMLLKRLTDRQEAGTPSSLIAITIDHGLQIQSAKVSEQCSAFAQSLGVESLSLKIPWGTPPFPAVPPEGAAFEKIARDARYHLLFQAMQKHNVSVIAFGHHADDQVETALLRTSRGSSVVGLAGMRPSRRWGMGFGDDTSSLGWAGYAGMHKWIIRPLLSVSKDRILSTCHEQRLDFVEDPTNVQPESTTRNSIRYALQRIDECGLDKSPLKIPVQNLLAEQDKMNGSNHNRGYSSEKESQALPVQGLLRSAVAVLSDQVVGLERAATSALEACIQSSPISTLLLTSEGLRRVSDNSTRLSMVRRILRYVSPHPWGSPRAEADGRSSSLQRIVNCVWEDGWGDSHEKIGSAVRRSLPLPFVAGAGVVWTPVAITPEGAFKYRAPIGDEKPGWLAHRQPPLRWRSVDVLQKSPSTNLGCEDLGKPLQLDITEDLKASMITKREVTILYDCRFVLHVKAWLLPHEIIKSLSSNSGPNQIPSQVVKKSPVVRVVPHSKFFLPRIVLFDPHRHNSSQERAAQDVEIEIARLLPCGRVDFRMRRDNKDGATSLELARLQVVRIESARKDDAVDGDLLRGANPK